MLHLTVELVYVGDQQLVRHTLALLHSPRPRVAFAAGRLDLTESLWGQVPIPSGRRIYARLDDRLALHVLFFGLPHKDLRPTESLLVPLLHRSKRGGFLTVMLVHSTPRQTVVLPDFGALPFDSFLLPFLSRRNSPEL